MRGTGSDMTWEWVGREGGRGLWDLYGPTAGLKNRLFQEGIYTFGCYLKSNVQA